MIPVSGFSPQGAEQPRWLAGVPDEVIMEDYAISNALLQPLMSEFRLRAMERGIDSANY